MLSGPRRAHKLPLDNSLEQRQAECTKCASATSAGKEWLVTNAISASATNRMRTYRHC